MNKKYIKYIPSYQVLSMYYVLRTKFEIRKNFGFKSINHQLCV